MALVAVALAGLAYGLYQAAKPEPRGGGNQLALPTDVPIALEGTSRVTSTSLGKVVWTMTSEGIRLYEKAEVVMVDRPTAWVPMADGGTVRVSGRTGEYFRKSEDITLTGEVAVELDRAGRREWAVAGDTASYRREEQAFYLAPVAGKMLPASGDSVQIQGARGRYDAPGRTMSVKQDVICKYSQGITIATDELAFDAARDLAHTDADVVVTGPGWKLSGRGMQAHLKDKKVEIQNAVKVRIEKAGQGQ
jgi:LPS export ABC transporter protein LptC